MHLEEKDLVRFWAKVDKTGDCWLWTAAKNLQGYGKFYLRGKFLGVHRVSYTLTKGAIAEGLVIDHECHTPSCVNPKHLRQVTYKQNNENLQGARSKNISGVRGVTWDAARNKWLACVRNNGKSYNLGRYPTIPEASKAVEDARLRMFTHSDMDLRTRSAK